MASYSELCDEKMNQLQNEETRLPVLQEMKDILTSIPRNEMSRAANSLQLPPIFDCLNDSNTEQVDLACEVLSLCMTNLNLGESTNKYGVFLERALNHPFPGVKSMALVEIKRNIQDEDVLVDLCKRESLLVNIVRCIGNDDLAVAKNASDIVEMVGLSSFGIKQLLKGEILKVIDEIMEGSEIVQLRVYEVVVKIASQSELNLELLKSTGLLSQIINCLNNDDVLLRLNVLELLRQFGQSKHGYEYLESNELLKKLSTMLEKDESSLMQLCEPGILKFFGSMARFKPMEVISKHHYLLQRLLSNLDSSNFNIVGVSLDTLGHIGLTNEGKIALDVTSCLMQHAVKKISHVLPQIPSEVKVRALNCLESLLRVVEPNNQVAAITRKWFNCIDDHPVDFIWKYAKNPFSEFRLAGLGVLNAMAAQLWGQEAIKNTPGLVEFLLDRNVETVKECKEAKYGVVEVLAVSPVFDEATNNRLQHFVKEGPYYVQTVTEVAIEGND